MLDDCSCSISNGLTLWPCGLIGIQYRCNLNNFPANTRNMPKLKPSKIPVECTANIRQMRIIFANE